MTAPVRVSINDLADEQLSATTVGNVLDTMLEETDFGMFVGVKQGRLVIRCNVQLPIKKTLILVGVLILLWQVAPDLAAFVPLVLASLTKG